MYQCTGIKGCARTCTGCTSVHSGYNLGGKRVTCQGLGGIPTVFTRHGWRDSYPVRHTGGVPSRSYRCPTPSRSYCTDNRHHHYPPPLPLPLQPTAIPFTNDCAWKFNPSLPPSFPSPLHPCGIHSEVATSIKEACLEVFKQPFCWAFICLFIYLFILQLAHSLVKMKYVAFITVSLFNNFQCGMYSISVGPCSHHKSSTLPISTGLSHCYKEH